MATKLNEDIKEIIDDLQSRGVTISTLLMRKFHDVSKQLDERQEVATGISTAALNDIKEMMDRLDIDKTQDSAGYLLESKIIQKTRSRLEFLKSITSTEKERLKQEIEIMNSKPNKCKCFLCRIFG